MSLAARHSSLMLLTTLAASVLALTGTGSGRGADHIWGVTVDSIENADQIVGALRDLPARTTARVVFDPGTTPDYYATAVRDIKRVAGVMGSPVDSAPPSGKMSVDQYRHRMATFMDGLGKNVDIWEVGNEVNGDWTGDSALMGAKISAGLDEAQKRGHKAAVCVFYSDYYLGTDREMATWAAKNLSPEVRKRMDYVLVSFYPDTADGKHPDWKKHFRRLGEVFPKAKLGFGELGLRNEDFTLSSDAVKKAALIKRYYRMESPLPGRYIGGYFWWTFRQDATPKGSGLWKTFEEAIGAK